MQFSLALLLLLGTAGVSTASPLLSQRDTLPLAGSGAGAGVQTCPRDQHYCDNLPPNVTASTDPRYTCGVFLLGPNALPNNPLFQDYVPYGGLCPGEWMKQYTHWNASKSRYDLDYPDYDGFQTDTSKRPIEGVQALPVGLLIDRFGAEVGGTYLSPFGTAFAQRGLYPHSLNTANASVPNNYHVYNVTKSFDVLAGPIAPAFGQPGQGVQYFTNGTGSIKQDVDWLRQKKYLTPVHYNYEDINE